MSATTSRTNTAMQRRQFLRTAVAVSGVLGVAGCLGDDTEDGDEPLGRGTLRIENQAETPVQAQYGLLGPDEAIEDVILDTVELRMTGDSFEVVYPEVRGGPRRFVVIVDDREGSPVEEPWELEECEEYRITARIFPDTLNMSEVSCIRQPVTD